MARLTQEQIDELNRQAEAHGVKAKEFGVGDYVADAVKSTASGIGRGIAAVPGMVGDIDELGRSLALKGREYLQGPESAQELKQSYEEDPRVAPTSGEIAAQVPGLDYEPKTAIGQGLQTIGEFAPGAVIPGQGAVRAATMGQRVARGVTDVAKFAVAPGLASEAAGAVTEGTQAEPYARALAAIAAAVGTGRLRDPSQATHVPGRHPGAVERVNRAIQDDGGFPRIQQELADVGEGAVLADTGPNLRGQADALSTSPGEGQRTIVDALRQRAQEAAGRTTTIADDVLGPHQNYAERTADLMATRKARADGMYGAARRSAGQIDTAPVVQAIEAELPTSLAAGAVEPTSLERTLLNVRDQIKNRSDINSLHSLKTSLDDQIGAAFRQGNNAEASKLITVRDQLLERMDAGTMQNGKSLYGEARREFAGDSAVLAAREEGRSLFNRDVRPDELALRLRKMTDSEKEAMREGARDQVHNIMGNARNDAQAVAGKFKEGFNREKLRLVTSGEEADKLLKVLEGEARKQGTFNRINGNSATAGRAAAQAELPNALAHKPVSEIPSLTQLPVVLAQRAVEKVGNAVQGAKANTIRRDMAAMLSQGGPDQMELLRQLQEAFRQRQRINPRNAMPFVAGGASQLDDNGNTPLTLTVRPGAR